MIGKEKELYRNQISGGSDPYNKEKKRKREKEKKKLRKKNVRNFLHIFLSFLFLIKF